MREKESNYEWQLLSSFTWQELLAIACFWNLPANLTVSIMTEHICIEVPNCKFNIQSIKATFSNCIPTDLFFHSHDMHSYMLWNYKITSACPNQVLFYNGDSSSWLPTLFPSQFTQWTIAPSLFWRQNPWSTGIMRKNLYTDSMHASLTSTQRRGSLERILLSTYAASLTMF